METSLRSRAGRWLGAWVAAQLALSGCKLSGRSESAQASQPAAATRIPVVIDGENGPVSFQSEIADTPELRARGLMNRKQLDIHEGMLFLFPEPEQQTFWMRDTLIPLDMIFIRTDRTILGIVENASPETDTRRAVPGESQFVLEIPGGAAKKNGIRTDQSVRFFAPIPEH